MKKTLTAVAILSACMANASAQSNVTIYGILDAGVTHLTNQPSSGRTTVEAGQLQTSRWGFRGVEDLGNGLKASFGLEGTLFNDTGTFGAATGTPASTAMFDRGATVGLAGGFGSVDIGRQNNLGIVPIALADPMGLSFAGTSPNVAFTGMNNAAAYGAFGSNNGGSALRQSNSVKYATPNINGFTFSAMRSFGEQAGNTRANAYTGVAAVYNSGPMGAAATYGRANNLTDSQTVTNWALAFKYSLPVAVLKTTYSSGEVDATNRKISVFGLGVDVPVAPAITLTGAFYNTRRSGDLSDDSQQYIAIGKYALSKRSTAYASIGRINSDRVVTATSLNLAPGIVAVGNDSANRYTMGVMHMY